MRDLPWIILTGAICLAASLAWGHGDGSEWIMRGNYHDASGAHCCTPGRDCLRAEPGEIRRVHGGWLHIPTDTELLDGDPGIHRSETAEMWRCVRGGKLRCVFISGGM